MQSYSIMNINVFTYTFSCLMEEIGKSKHSLIYRPLVHAGFCWEKLKKGDHLKDLSLNRDYH
jgi:hypothetical protein